MEPQFPPSSAESIANAAPELNAIKAAYQSVVKNALTPNSSYIGTGGGLFANNIYGGPYLAPYSIQFNGGVQHEIKPGLLLSADYVHNATLKIPISVDVNHDGAARTLVTSAAQASIASNSRSQFRGAICRVSHVPPRLHGCFDQLRNRQRRHDPKLCLTGS